MNKINKSEEVYNLSYQELYEISQIEFYCRDLEQTLTLREYYITLLTTLIHKGEGFSGKHPFGNSGWHFDLYKALIKAGVVHGVLDEEGDVEEFYPQDEQIADILLLEVAANL